MLDLLWLPFLAGLVLAGIHAYLGLHVLARGVIFVDLALAQVAALGMTVALLAGHSPFGAGAYAYSLGFTAVGAAIFATTRERLGGGAGRYRAMPQEAIIGIVYAVSAALAVLVLERVPQGSEYIKQLLVGSILSVTLDDVMKLAGLYGAIGLFHWLARRPLRALSFGGDELHPRLWDFAFYFTFGIVVTSSVRIAGVLLVFSYLIVPAVAGAWLAGTIGRRLAIGWTVGVVGSVGGLATSYVLDLPTGATVVAAFGAVLAAIGVVRAIVALTARWREDRSRVVAGLLLGLGVIVALAGAALSAFPGADHLWLDALERVAPSVQRAFLTPHERRVFAESHQAIARGAAELARLRAFQADVQWGTRDLTAEQRERLRQFLAGRDEIVAGDRLVLRTLRAHARERQRYALGLPLMAAGVAFSFLGFRLRHG